MGLMGALRWRMRRRWASSALIAALLAVAWMGCAAEQQSKQSLPLGPVKRISLAALGYVAPNPSYLRLRLSFNSLDFIDADHLLFTFHKMGLLERAPDDEVGDNDQEIEAVVLDTSTGKVVRKADWRMHDRQRYLWALRDGTFLVRVRNSFFLTDKSLELRPYLSFDTDVEAVQVSPGRGLLVIEVKKPTVAAKEGAETPSLFSESRAKQLRTEILLLRPGGRTVLGAGETLTATYVPLLEDGILSVDEGKKPKQWVVMKISLDKTRKIIGEVTSECDPQLVTLSDDVALAQNCPAHGSGGTEVDALSMQGGILWRDHWDSKYIWPHFESSVDGSRFVYESLEMNREIGSVDYFGEEDVESQPVGVFDTATGKLVLVKDASPILSAGQNFALSADGRRFAILRNGAIEVYDLPPVAEAGESGKGKGEKKK